jgi:pimeloyl-ACP methyl ester carboxylesterase
MRYFNGFCLKGEEVLFEPYLIQSDFTVAGFSYGAIKAVEFALTCKERIDTLQLFSPAFFQDRDAKFKKLQTLSFAKNPDAYCHTFLQNCAPISLESFFEQGTHQELEALLNYTWDTTKLSLIQEKGINIEVYVGEQDAIIHALHVKDFFVPFATVYYFKKVGHCLC